MIPASCNRSKRNECRRPSVLEHCRLRKKFVFPTTHRLGIAYRAPHRLRGGPIFSTTSHMTSKSQHTTPKLGLSRPEGSSGNQMVPAFTRQSHYCWMPSKYCTGPNESSAEL